MSRAGLAMVMAAAALVACDGAAGQIGTPAAQPQRFQVPTPSETAGQTPVIGEPRWNEPLPGEVWIRVPTPSETMGKAPVVGRPSEPGFGASPVQRSAPGATKPEGTGGGSLQD
jgi:hypothetical protein